ncbi:hypothetical protein ALTERO38_51162 [Alteromonas sp. 38]|nr:hypothetical protein ALTER154_70344 [Alteromonas sp. 154]VXB63110.1 hypothetical protein ALTERO38_51162 [Alteromonas sp. 38]
MVRTHSINGFKFESKQKKREKNGSDKGRIQPCIVTHNQKLKIKLLYQQDKDWIKKEKIVIIEKITREILFEQ